MTTSFIFLDPHADLHVLIRLLEHIHTKAPPYNVYTQLFVFARRVWTNLAVLGCTRDFRIGEGALRKPELKLAIAADVVDFGIRLEELGGSVRVGLNTEEDDEAFRKWTKCSAEIDAEK